MTRTQETGPVLILGATSDIALAIAHQYGAQGRALVLAARAPDQLDRQCQDLRVRHGVEVSTRAFDVLDIEGHASFAQSLDPMPTTIVCAVGYMGDEETSRNDAAAADLVMRSNFSGPAILAEALCQRWVRDGLTGTLIGISSVAGDRGRAKNSYYGSAKAGFTAFLSGLRQRLNGTGIHVMTVNPGFVATRMTEGMDLPKPLTLQPGAVARDVIKADRSRSNVVYDWRWRIVMTAVRLLPEGIFKKLKF